MGKRCLTKEEIERGIKRKCCQAKTRAGTRCTRKAVINVDLRKERKIFGYNLPKINCCFLCLQHASLFLGVSISRLGNVLAESELDWDEYLALKPEYLNESIESLK